MVRLVAKLPNVSIKGGRPLRQTLRGRRIQREEQRCLATSWRSAVSTYIKIRLKLFVGMMLSNVVSGDPSHEVRR
jgi:hypothetical protein